MSVLTDKVIKEYLADGRICISPKPEGVQFQPCSVDLRLDDKYVRFDTGGVIDTRKEVDCTCRDVFTVDDPLVLGPGDFVLCQTVEVVSLPGDVVARVEGRSSLGRCGVMVHVTAGFVDPGFVGNVTLEVVNVGVVPVVLYPGMRVCQIVFEECVGVCEWPYGVGGRGKYQGQVVPTVGRCCWDDEMV